MHVHVHAGLHMTNSCAICTGLASIHNKMLGHSNVTNDNQDLRKLTLIQSLSTQLTPIGTTSRMSKKLPPAKLTSTYQTRTTKLHFTLARLLGFLLSSS